MSNEISLPITHCRICFADHLVPVLDLGQQPLANALVSNPLTTEHRVPLTLCRCLKCSTVQLTETVNPKVLFQHYVWVTGTSSTAKNYSETFCERLSAHLPVGTRFIIEIASNDGTFLRPFSRQGDRVLGVDPANNIAKQASENGIATVAEFFSYELAKSIKKNHGVADAIIARNVIPHVADVHDVLRGVEFCLSDRGVVAIEFHRADIILQELHYDSIYHEHVCYHSIHSLNYLLGIYGLFAFDVELSPISGGSYVLYASKWKPPKSDRFSAALRNELCLGVTDDKHWEQFAVRARSHRDSLKYMIKQFLAAGERLVAWGASARSSTLLNFCELRYPEITAILDNATLKHGLFTPGTHIPILPAESINELAPTVILLLAWNFKEELLYELQRKYSWRGTVILPLPNQPRAFTI